MKSFSASCYWFLICANYFPLNSYLPSSKCDIFNDFMQNLIIFQNSPIICRINKQMIKLSTDEQKEINTPQIQQLVHFYEEKFSSKGKSL